MKGDSEGFKRLLEMVKEDKDFFHSLVFDPESTLGRLDFLDRNAKGRLLASDPGEIVARTVGILAACGNTCTSSCDNTCGGSCGYTTNLTIEERARVSYYARDFGTLEACGNTCTSSCDNTCGGSCGYTTNLTMQERAWGL